MLWSVLLIFMSTNSLLAANQAKESPKTLKGIVPQALPIVTWLKAAKNGDQKQLKTVFSESMQKRLEEEGWDKVLKTYQEGFKKEFGDYKIEEFTFEFQGKKEEGEVSIIHKGKKLPGLRVIKEKADWKVNER